MGAVCVWAHVTVIFWCSFLLRHFVVPSHNGPKCGAEHIFGHFVGAWVSVRWNGLQHLVFPVYDVCQLVTSEYGGSTLCLILISEHSLIPGTNFSSILRGARFPLIILVTSAHRFLARCATFRRHSFLYVLFILRWGPCLSLS